MSEPDDHLTTQVVYDATAELYAERIGTTIGPATEGPIDRAALEAFVELVGPGGGRVADVGCGPGRVAAFLSERGIDVVGFDVAPKMLLVARRSHPGITFEAGSLIALPLAQQSLAGAVCWYSIIHTPPEGLGDVAAELMRVLSSGAHLLMAFQSGAGEAVHRADAYGTGVRLTSYRHDPNEVARVLDAQGLSVHARVVRDPTFEHESTPQAFRFARAG